MAVVLAPATAGTYYRTFTVAANLGDAALDSGATAHGLGSTPVDYSIVDTTVASQLSVCPWAVHSVGPTTFVVRKLIATNENRTALVVLRAVHSKMR